MRHFTQCRYLIVYIIVHTVQVKLPKDVRLLVIKTKQRDHVSLIVCWIVGTSFGAMCLSCLSPVTGGAMLARL